MGIEKNVEDCLVLRINQFVPKRVVFGTRRTDIHRGCSNLRNLTNSTRPSNVRGYHSFHAHEGGIRCL